jgi:trehalose-phosphatase
MKILTEGTDVEGFLEGLGRSDGRLLMLDYDGTLSPYQKERHEAFPYPGIRDILLRALSSPVCRTVIVSGRTIADLIPLLGIESGIEIWGCHGWERLGADGEYTPPDLPPEAVSGLEEGRRIVEEAGRGDRLEVKAASVAVHWRGLEKNTRDRLESEFGRGWERIAESGPLELHPFSGGIELRPSGMDKGRVVEKLLGESPGSAAAYLGDDFTDEDAFRALSGRGLSVLVNLSIRETAADLWLVPPEELIWFLERWMESCGV